MSRLHPEFPETDGRPQVKVCGLTRPVDARLALDMGAAFLGLILTTKSPRHLPLERAETLVAEVRHSAASEPRFIGVFVDEPPQEIAEAVDRLKLVAVQVHAGIGRLMEYLPPEKIIPAMGIRGPEDVLAAEAQDERHPAVLTDAFAKGRSGGTGKVFDHELVRPLFGRRRIFLAGGLKPDNVAGIVARLLPGPMPYALDLSSGIEEEPGIKSAALMTEFFEKIHQSLGGRRTP